MSASVLSVVVTIVEGQRALRACLNALANQKHPPPLQVVVPFDASVAWVSALATEYPQVEFCEMGPVPTARPAHTPAGQHELFDRRRSAGLAATTGDLIAILEDRGIPEPVWAASIVELHKRYAWAVIGGAVECGIDAHLNWAVYFCDFGRYQPPFVAGPRTYVTDVNISYKRRALEQTRHLWNDRYHETTVNWALQHDGETLYLTPAFVVSQQRTDLRLRPLLRERLDWGRLFAFTRAREYGFVTRLVYGLSALGLPVLLFVRHGLMQFQKKRYVGRFLVASPVVLLLLISWSLGESLGYFTRRA